MKKTHIEYIRKASGREGGSKGRAQAKRSTKKGSGKNVCYDALT